MSADGSPKSKRSRLVPVVRLVRSRRLPPRDRAGLLARVVLAMVDHDPPDHVFMRWDEPMFERGMWCIWCGASGRPGVAFTLFRWACSSCVDEHQLVERGI